MRSIVLIAHNLRSAHNVGSLLRTAEGMAAERVWLTGYSPYPAATNDARLPHLKDKINRLVAKTSLGAEKTLDWKHGDIETVIKQLKSEDYTIAALEQAKGSVALPEFAPPARLALVVGREVEGLEKEVLALCDRVVEIPMLGQKESYNVVQAAAMALYHCRFKS